MALGVTVLQGGNVGQFGRSASPVTVPRPTGRAGSAPRSRSVSRDQSRGRQPTAPQPGRRPRSLSKELTRPRAKTLEDLDFRQRLAILGDGSLVVERPRTSMIYDMELATLQRMAIHDLQHRLVRLISHIHNEQWADQTAMDMAKGLLEDYCEYLQNSCLLISGASM